MWMDAIGLMCGFREGVFIYCLLFYYLLFYCFGG